METNPRSFIRGGHCAGNLLAAKTDALDGLPVNVGSGKAVSVAKLRSEFPMRSE